MNDFIFFCKTCKKSYSSRKDDTFHSDQALFISIPKKLVEGYTVEDFLGEGSYGCVIKVKDINDDSFYAMKIMNENEKNEIDILKNLDHPNIIAYKKTYKDEKVGMFAMVIALADKSLENIMQKLTEIEAINIFSQIIEAIGYIHRRNIIHGDLKPSNILIKDNVVKVVDFGTAHEKKSKCSEIYSLVKEPFGTKLYLPPEINEKIINNDDSYLFNSKMDIWALGILLHQMLFQGRHPFDDPNKPKTIVNNILKNILFLGDFSSFFNKDLEKLVKRKFLISLKNEFQIDCLAPNPDERISIDEISKILGKMKGIDANKNSITIKYSNNSWYEGQMLNNTIKHGKGKLTFPSGSYYEGNFVMNKKEGYGEYYYKIGNFFEKYEGKWLNDMKNDAQGKYYFENNDQYIGGFVNNAIEGYGVCIYYNKSEYKGMWKNSQKNGKGVFTYNNGDVYDGDFCNDKREGYGTYIYKAIGYKYIGNWLNDKRNGKGILYKLMGEKEIEEFNGLWENDFQLVH